MKKFATLLLVVVLGISSRGAAAQEWLDSPSLDDLPPLIDMENGVPETLRPRAEAHEMEVLEPMAEPYDHEFDESHFLQGFPSLLESSGTWIRRGFWYTEVDAVFYNRSFGRSDRVLMNQPTGIKVGQFGQQAPVEFNQLAVGSTRPGLETVPRITLGRFMFRDHKNRDHNLEFTAFGGGNFSQSETLEASTDNDLGTNFLFVPVQTSKGNASFEGANFSQFDYDSQFNSFELNYIVKQRMWRDRMEMEPSGKWVRRAQPSMTHSVLAGIRYFDLHERLLWEAFGIPDADGDGINERGTYNVRTRNDMIGTQLGLSSTYETGRWSAGISTKGGMFINFLEMRSDFEVTGDVTSGANDLTGTNMSFIGEVALLGKYHLRPNVSIRAGMELLWVVSVADASRQVNFVPGGNPRIDTVGESVYLGGSLGIEGYW